MWIETMLGWLLRAAEPPPNGRIVPFQSRAEAERERAEIRQALDEARRQAG